jgi:hypothetical protein
MSQSNRRLFSKTNSIASMSQTRAAFTTGEFTPEVIAYLEKNKIPPLFRDINDGMTSITLTAAIFKVSEGILMEIFVHLPKQVDTVNFNFGSLERKDLETAQRLMGYSVNARHVTQFNLTGPDVDTTDQIKKFFEFYRKNSNLVKVINLIPPAATHFKTI